MAMAAYCTSSLSVLLAFLLLRASALPFPSQNSTCHPKDLVALRGFFMGLSSVVPGWPVMISNSTGNCCNWSGVHCEEVEGRVARLELGYISLRSGSDALKSLSGLERLKVLNLFHNSVAGYLPSELLHLKHLQVLDLSFNKLHGHFPLNSSLPSLRVFNISSNSFTGSFPVLLNSPRLTSFAIEAGNYFYGYLDKELCFRSPKITGLHLSGNNFSGILHSGIANCTNLVRLDLDSNALVGNLPDELFRIPKLELLSVQDNMLSGLVSERIGYLSSLLIWDMSFNGFFGKIPDVFDRMERLEQFSAISNRFSGLLPTTLSNVSTLELLKLRNNSLQGEISLNCATMVSLGSLDLGSNQFTSRNLHKLSDCRKLRTLNLSRSRLYGLFPDSFKELQHLSYLALSKIGLRSLSSALMALAHWKELTTLVLTGNFKGEVMPMDGIKGFERMTALIIGDCQLAGYIPPWLSRCSSLQLLDLSWNNLEGGIPYWIGNLDTLFYLDLSNNSLSGEVPRSMAQLKSLISPYLSEQDLLSDVPLLKGGLQYNQLLNFLDLSCNHLTGSIWPEFGNLKALDVLILSRNNLSGSIPDKLSAMRNIGILNLSHNQLSGTIPTSLTELSFLASFDVSHNQLSGIIPGAGQFSTFPNSSFEGNLGLCGFQYSPCQSIVLPNDHGIRGLISYNTYFDVQACAMGVVTGFLVTIGIVALTGKLF